MRKQARIAPGSGENRPVPRGVGLLFKVVYNLEQTCAAWLWFLTGHFYVDNGVVSTDEAGRARWWAIAARAIGGVLASTTGGSRAMHPHCIRRGSPVERWRRAEVLAVGRAAGGTNGARLVNTKQGHQDILGDHGSERLTRGAPACITRKTCKRPVL